MTTDPLPFGPMPVTLGEMPELVVRSRKPCLACHCTNALNPHRICKRKVQVLIELARLLALGDPWVRVEEGHTLVGTISNERRTVAYRARAHASRLGWFGLAEHREFRTPEWRISKNGLLFLKGELAVPAKILCTDGVVLYESVELASIHSVRGVDLDKAYWDGYPWSDMEERL